MVEYSLVLQKCYLIYFNCLSHGLPLVKSGHLIPLFKPTTQTEIAIQKGVMTAGIS